MTPTIIIIFCSLLLVAYLFNLTASKTKIPSVILLLLLGWGIQQVTVFMEFSIPDFSEVLPVLATMGLILIVLEGALELQLNRSKVGIITKSSLGALLTIFILAFVFANFLQSFGYSFKDSLINVIPICIISSAIAIPSVVNLKPFSREFTLYESSLSDIFGVIFFNFMVLNNSIDSHSFTEFGLQLLIIVVISLVATIALALLLGKIDHHVKFVPIILLVILIYAISKLFHLPGLIFILIFGLSIGNLNQVRRIKWVRRFNTDALQNEIQKFRELTVEGAFLIRALFFILFGYLLDTNEILNLQTIVWSVGISITIFLLRAVQLKLSRLPLMPLLFVAPRGLVTILLFLSIPVANSIPLINKSVIIQVILISSLVMTFGLIANAKKEKKEEEEKTEEMEVES